MIFLILFLILLKDGECCLGNNNIPMTFEPNKYNATPGCGNDTEATYCTHFDGKEKDFHPKYGHEISNGASYEALHGRNSVSNFYQLLILIGPKFVLLGTPMVNKTGFDILIIVTNALLGKR